MTNRKTSETKKGFTLAEMLIVVAIIGVLTATAVPIFSSLSERAKEATDLANIRSAYAEVMVEVVVDQSTTHSAVVTMVQSKPDWQNDDTKATLQRLAPGHIEGAPSGEKGAQTTVQWNIAGYLEIIFDGEGSGDDGGGGSGAGTYNFGYERKTRMVTMAQAIKDVIANADSNFVMRYLPWKKGHEGNYEFYGDHYSVDYIEKHMSLTYTDLNKEYTYYPAGGGSVTTTMAQLLQDAGADISGFTDANYVGESSVIYFDLDTYQPIAVSYFNEDNKYRMVYLNDDGTTTMYATNNGAYGRQYIAYHRDYAEANLTEITDE